MKVTIGDLYDELGKRIAENGDWFRDMIIISTTYHSKVLNCNQLPYDYNDNLWYLDILAISEDGKLMTVINEFNNKN